MSDVRVVLKDQGVVKSALIHKGTLNAFHDPRWYGEGPLSHPLLSMFGDAPVAPEDTPYGTVVIDRDTQWVGSCQGYMALEAVEVWAGGYTVKQCQALDLDAELARFAPYLWSALLVQPPARLHLFKKAFDEGLITQVRTGKWGDSAPWEPLSDLGLLDAQAALDWLDARRQEIMGGDCVLTKCAFRFSPPGWTIRDYDMSDEIQTFEQAMIERGWENQCSHPKKKSLTGRS